MQDGPKPPSWNQDTLVNPFFLNINHSRVFFAPPSLPVVFVLLDKAAVQHPQVNTRRRAECATHAAWAFLSVSPAGSLSHARTEWILCAQPVVLPQGFPDRRCCHRRKQCGARGRDGKQRGSADSVFSNERSVMCQYVRSHSRSELRKKQMVACWVSDFPFFFQSGS